MANLKDVMSSELQQSLKMYREHALSIFRGLRSGVIDDQEAARSFMHIYESFFEWKIEQCGYGAAHPCHIFASRLLRATKMLMGEKWVKSHFPYLWREFDSIDC